MGMFIANKYHSLLFQVSVDGNKTLSVDCAFTMADKLLYPNIDGRLPVVQASKKYRLPLGYRLPPGYR